MDTKIHIQIHLTSETASAMGAENYEEEFIFGIRIVKEVGGIIRKSFNSEKSVTEKTSHNDLGKFTIL